MKKKIRLFCNNSRNIYASTLKGITRKVYSREYPIKINKKNYGYQSSKSKRNQQIQFKDDNEKQEAIDYIKYTIKCRL